MDNRPEVLENPYAAPPIEADLAMAYSPFGADLSQDEQIRHEYLSHEASVRSVGILYYLGAFFLGIGSLSTVAFFLLPVLLSSGDSQMGSPDNLAFAIVIPAILLALYGLLTVLFFFTARGLRRLQPWSRISSGILSGLGLLQFPIGTLINVYILYLLLSPKGGMVFSPEYREIIARTPHIKCKTSLLVKILAVGNFLGRVVVAVVRADHEHGQLGRDTLDITVIQPPKDVLGAIAADAQVDGVARSVVFVPNGLSAAFPAVGDGVADQQHIDVPLGNPLVHLRMAIGPPFVVAGDRFDGVVLLGVVGRGHGRGEAG